MNTSKIEIGKEREKMNTICVCELERNYDFTDAQLEEIKRTETMPDGEKVVVTGHWNQAGGVCCPHQGNTCGFHHEWKG